MLTQPTIGCYYLRMSNSFKQKSPINPLVEPAISAAGGASAVALALNLKSQTIYKWLSAGMPRTEWTGETAYLQHLEQLQLKRSGRVVHSANDIKQAQNFSAKN